MSGKQGEQHELQLTIASKDKEIRQLKEQLESQRQVRSAQDKQIKDFKTQIEQSNASIVDLKLGKDRLDQQVAYMKECLSAKTEDYENSRT